MTIKFEPTRGRQCGVTWPELYLLALVATDDPQSHYNSGKAKTRQKMMNVVPMSTGIIWRMRLTMYLNMVFLTSNQPNWTQSTHRGRSSVVQKG